MTTEQPMTWQDIAAQLEALAGEAGSCENYTQAVEASQRLNIALRNNLPTILAALRAREWQGMETARFLADRISELEFTDDGWADFQRDWFGHVEPALERLKMTFPAQEGEG